MLAPPGVYESTLRQKGNYLIYGNNDLKFISKNAGKSWFEYRSTNWDNYLEVTDDYVIRLTNLSSYYSQDLVNWQKIKLYFGQDDEGFITSGGDVYLFDGYELKKEEKGRSSIEKDQSGTLHWRKIIDLYEGKFDLSRTYVQRDLCFCQ